MSEGFTNPINTSISTSGIEGYSLGELEKIWKNLAESEARLQMMEKLDKYKVGFNDVENFNLGLIYNSKTMNHDDDTDKDDRKIIEVAMNFKKKDEIRNRKRILKEKIKVRRLIETELGRRTNKQKRLLKHLKSIAGKKKKEQNEKYESKIEHLRRKYEVDKEKEIDKVPQEMKGFEQLAIFDKDKFEEIRETEIEIVKYGKVEIDEDEEAALKLHPKMALPKKMEEGYLNLAMDISYTKVRWQLRKEEEEEGKKQPTEEDYEDSKVDSKKEKKIEEERELEETRTRIVYDSELKIYDERKQRVTDKKNVAEFSPPSH